MPRSSSPMNELQQKLSKRRTYVEDAVLRFGACDCVRPSHIFAPSSVVIINRTRRTMQNINSFNCVYIYILNIIYDTTIIYELIISIVQSSQSILALGSDHTWTTPTKESGLKFESQPAAHEAGEGSTLLCRCI